MKTQKYFLPLALVGTLFLTSCNDDDGYSLDKFWVSVGTVQNGDNSSYFFLDLDNGKRLWTVATNLPYYRPAIGQRVIADYTILSDREEASSYDHDVKLNDVCPILTKDIVNITSENDEELGNDPVKITDIWVGGDHLNVEFVFAGYSKVHFINLGLDEANDYNDGKVHLELRHNAYGDRPAYNMWGIASFRLKSLQEDGVESIAIIVHVNEYGTGEEKTYELTYDFNSQAAIDKAFNPGENIGSIE
ncbi:MAG: NigD-like protein [Prevotellaceae bacterium]|jgi:hypothetical protein|nr:NigD-like protein [Prevotellaceae bacterium]